jgi:serine/threonine protein phosphatase PrpC
LAINEVFSNKLQEEQVNGELECLVLASDGLWDVVENEVINILPCSAVHLNSSKHTMVYLISNQSIASLSFLFAFGLCSYCSQNAQL